MVNINGQSISLDEACLIGIRYYQQQESNEAVKVFSQVIAVDPVHPRALNALAVIDSEKGNYDRAQVWLATLLKAHPDFEKGYNTRGMLLLKLKKMEEAERDFQKAISLNIDFAEAYGNLGNIYLLLRRFKAAVDSFSRVICLNPKVPQAYCSLANAQVMQGLHDEAATNINMALDLDPDFAPAHLAKGDLLRELRCFPEAIAAYETALKYKPGAAIYHRCLGNAHYDSGNLPHALECLLESLRLDPSDPLAEYSLGNIYWEKGHLHAAALAYQRGLQLATLSTDIFLLRSGLGSVYVSLGHPDEAMAEFRTGLVLDPDNALLHSNLLLAMHYSAEIANDEIFRESVAWGCNHSTEPISNGLQIGDFPLKIGFISADFRTHSVSYFFEPLLAELDRKRFKVYCYSGVRKPDATTKRLKSMADCWVDCYNFTDDLLAEKITSEKIDILVDLSGHTSGNRLNVFARKPAPVQISWLGYPDTTGLRAIDYRISDAITDPVGIADQLHTEKLIRLSDCFLCYLPPQDAPQVLPPPVLQKQHVTFGSFNNLAKITPDVLTVWSKILTAVPAAHLLLKSRTFADDYSRQYWLNLLTTYGFENDRIRLIPFECSKRDHFAQYGEIDIALDTFPYNGTTTTCEALWMGVPVITMTGERHSSRVGASLLSSVGLNEHVVESPEEYVAKAVNLAGNVDKLLSYRQTMRNRLLASPLFDAAAFAKRWEDAVLNIFSENGAD